MCLIPQSYPEPLLRLFFFIFSPGLIALILLTVKSKKRFLITRTRCTYVAIKLYFWKRQWSEMVSDVRSWGTNGRAKCKQVCQKLCQVEFGKQAYLIKELWTIKKSYWYFLLLGPILGPCTTLCANKSKSESGAKYVGPARRLANLQSITDLIPNRI